MVAQLSRPRLQDYRYTAPMPRASTLLVVLAFAIVMGFAVKYDVVDLVGTRVSIAAKLPKAALAKLTKVNP